MTWKLGMQEHGKQRFQVQDLAPVLEPLLSALFSAFLKPDSAENEYVMRCIMRVIDFVGPEVSSMITTTSAGLEHFCVASQQITACYLNIQSLRKIHMMHKSAACCECRLHQQFHHVYQRLLGSKEY